MTQVSDVVWVRCSDCGNTLNGNARGALRWTRCPACSSSRLVFAAPFAAAECPPAQPGQLLSRWQADYRAAAGLPNPQPVYGPKAAPVQAAPAPAPAPMPAPAPAPVADSQTPTPVAVPVLPPGPAGPEQPAAPRRRPQTGMVPGVPKQASKTLVIVRLLVAFGAIFIAAVILVVFMLTKDNQTQDTAQGDPNPPVTPLPPVNRPPVNRPRTDPVQVQARRASAAYMEKLPGWLDMLRIRCAALGEGFTELSGAHDAWRDAAMADVARRRQAAQTARAEGDSERTKAAQEIENSTATLKKMREEQNPLSRFVLAYGALDPRLEAYDAAKSAAQATAITRAQTDDACRALEARLLEAADPAAQAKLEKELETAGQARDAALEADTAAQEALAARRADLSEARAELDGAAARVPADTDEGKALQPAWADYMKAGAGIREAEAMQEAVDAKVRELEDELAAAQSTLDDKRRVYKDVHASYLEVAGDLSRATIALKNNPTTDNKKRYDDLKIKEAGAKEEDTAARNEMNAADKSVRDVKEKIRKAERDAPRLEEAVKAAVKAAAGSKAKFEQVLEPIRARVVRDETARNQEMQRLEAAISAARTRQGEMNAKVKDADAEIDRLAQETTRLEKMGGSFQTSEVMQLQEPPAAALQKMIERLEGFQKMDFLTQAQARSVAERMTLIENALASLMRITNDPAFSDRFSGAQAPALEKWTEASADTLRLVTDIRESSENLAVILAGTKES